MSEEQKIPHPTIEKYARYVNPSFVKLLGLFGYGRVYTKAEDVWVWDHQGNKYLDFLSGFGSVNIGHNHPYLLEKIQDFAQSQILNLCHTGPSIHTANLAEKLSSIVSSPLEISLFASSGAEAVEAGMKLARAVTKRSCFLYCEGGFHGTNLGTLSIMGEERMRKPFQPLLESQKVKFGDIEELKKNVATKKIAGFIVEPIQAEAGVVIPPPGYLKEAYEICKHYKTLFILDEVQTGLGRTGTMFAYESENFVPDVLILAKALSGSIAPISVAITSSKMFNKAYGSVESFDLHSSTYEGNAFSCIVASTTIDIIQNNNLVTKSASQGQKLLESLKKELEGHPFVKDIRGRGLLAAIELGPTEKGWANKLAPSLVEGVSRKIFGQWAAFRLLQKGMICQPAAHQWNVLKLEPPLTINDSNLEQGVKMIGEVFREYSTISSVVGDATKQLGKQMLKGWKFE